MSSKTAKPARASCKKPAPGSCTNCHASWKRGPGCMQNRPRLHAAWIRASRQTCPGFMQNGSGRSCKAPDSCTPGPGFMQNVPGHNGKPAPASCATGLGFIQDRPWPTTDETGFIQHRARPTREASRSVVSPGHSTSRVYRVLHSVARVIKVASGFLISPPAYSKYPPA